MNGTRITSFVTCALVALLVAPPRLNGQVVSGPDIWRVFTERLEPGKTLKVRLKNGQRFDATLLQVSPDSMTVQPQRRAAVPPQRVAFTEIETLEVESKKGVSLGRAVAVGAGIAAGVWLAMMAFAFAVLAD